MCKRGCDLLAIAFERVDPKIERRAARERCPFYLPLLAEHARKGRVEPLRIVSRNPRRGIVEAVRRKARPLLLAERLRRKSRSGEQVSNRGYIEFPSQPEHSEDDRPRALGTHQMRRRGSPAQRVVDEPGDRGPVA